MQNIIKKGFFKAEDFVAQLGSERAFNFIKELAETLKKICVDQLCYTEKKIGILVVSPDGKTLLNALRDKYKSSIVSQLIRTRSIDKMSKVAENCPLIIAGIIKRELKSLANKKRESMLEQLKASAEIEMPVEPIEVQFDLKDGISFENDSQMPHIVIPKADDTKAKQLLSIKNTTRIPFQGGLLIADSEETAYFIEKKQAKKYGLCRTN